MSRSGSYYTEKRGGGEHEHKRGWITQEQLLESAEVYGKSNYGKHLKQVADGRLLY